MAHSESDSSSSAGLTEGRRTGRPIPAVRVWVLALAAGLMAGLVSWMVEELVHGRYGPQSLVSNKGSLNPFPSAAETQQRATAHRAAETLDTTLVFGSLGAVLGLALGLAGGLARVSNRAAWAAAIGGSILAAIVGVALTRIMLPIYVQWALTDSNSLFTGILFYLVIASAIGVSSARGIRRRAG